MNNKKLYTLLIVFVVVLGLLVALIVGTVNFGNKPNGDLSDSSETVSEYLTTESSASEISEIAVSEESVGETSESSEEVKTPELILLPNISLVSENVIVYSVLDDAVIYEEKPDERCSPASITKLITALVALEHLDVDRVIRVGDEIDLVGENSSIAWLYKDQYITVEKLIDALLIPSGNDAAYTLAVNTARTAIDKNLTVEDAIAEFIKLMNQKATELGCVDTSFASPDGYDADGQFTTARDLMLISSAAYENEIIKNSAGKYESGDWTNSNVLLNKDGNYYCKYVTGLKTGSTDAAGYCVSVSAEIEGNTYIMVFLGSATKEGRFIDAINVVDSILGGGLLNSVVGQQ